MVASLDTSLGQYLADAVLLVLVAVNAWLGWRFGLLRRLVGFAGLYLGCFAATAVGNAVAAAVHPGSVEANAWAFVSVLVFVVLAVEVLGALYNDRIQLIAVAMFDRVAGAMAGLVTGLAQALVLFLVAFAVAGTPSSAPGAVSNRAAAADAIQSSMIASAAMHLTPQLHAIFAPVLPTHLDSHLDENAHVALPPL